MSKSHFSRLVLGTAQFGLDYGITNSKGVLSPSDIRSILSQCKSLGIRILDTAQAYGKAESILGELQASTSFSIGTKIAPKTANEIESLVQHSCRSLGVRHLDYCLIHNIHDSIDNPEILEALSTQKQRGHLSRIGASLYHPQELKSLINLGWHPDIIQAPYSVMDQQFSKVAPLLIEKGISFHARSLFLQGILLQDPSDIPSFLSPLKSPFQSLHKKRQEHGISALEHCLGAGLCQDWVTNLVVGISSVSEFEDICDTLSNLTNEKLKTISQIMTEFSQIQSDLLNPTNWPKQSKESTTQ